MIQAGWDYWEEYDYPFDDTSSGRDTPPPAHGETPHGQQDQESCPSEAAISPLPSLGEVIPAQRRAAPRQAPPAETDFAPMPRLPAAPGPTRGRVGGQPRRWRTTSPDIVWPAPHRVHTPAPTRQGQGLPAPPPQMPGVTAHRPGGGPVTTTGLMSLPAVPPLPKRETFPVAPSALYAMRVYREAAEARAGGPGPLSPPQEVDGGSWGTPTPSVDEQLPDWLRAVNRSLIDGGEAVSRDGSPASIPLLPHPHMSGSRMHLPVSGVASNDWLNPCTRPRGRHSGESAEYKGSSREAGGRGGGERRQSPRAPMAGVEGKRQGSSEPAWTQQGYSAAAEAGSYETHTKDGTLPGSDLSSTEENGGFVSIKHAQRTMTPVSQRTDSYTGGSSVTGGAHTPQTDTAHGGSPSTSTNLVNGARSTGDGSEDHLVAPRRPKENNYFNNAILRKQRQQISEPQGDGNEGRPQAVGEGGQRTSPTAGYGHPSPQRVAALAGGTSHLPELSEGRVADPQHTRLGSANQPNGSSHRSYLSRMGSEGELSVHPSGISLTVETTFVVYRGP